METIVDSANYAWLFHYMVADIVMTLGLISIGYSIACIVFRLSIIEQISPDEWTQFLASLMLAGAILLSKTFEETKSPYGDEIHYAKAGVLLALLRWTFVTQIRGPKCSFDPEHTYALNNKVVVLTGGTSGVGLETARELLRAYPRIRLVLPCRDLSKGQMIKKELGSESVIVELMDLDSLQSVRDFCERTKDSLPVVDVLINNAGGMLLKKCVTKDGFEAMIQSNCLAPFLLSILLLPRLAKSDVGRIINVTSSTSRKPKHVNFDDMNGDKYYSILSTYAHSKFCQNQLTVELAFACKAVDVDVFGCHPGAVQTAVSRHLPLFFQLGHKMIRAIVKVPLEGCQTVLYLAVNRSKVSHKQTGKFFEHLEPCSVRLADGEERKKLLRWCEEGVNCKLDDVVSQIVANKASD